MFNDIYRILDNFEAFSNQFNAEELINAAIENARTMARSYIRGRLISYAEDAIEMTEEYNYEPLRTHLLQNLMRDEHYIVNSDATDMAIFNEDIAGTLADFEAGQHAAWSSSAGTPAQRAFCWKYGIYKPEREGFIGSDYLEKRFSDYPSYSEVIETRLEVWGDKAPYWYFLEHGTSGGGLPYPSFPGTGFIQKVRAEKDSLLRLARETALAEFESAIDDAVGEQLDYGDERYVQVYIGRITYGRDVEGRLVQVQASRRGGEVYYQLVVGGRFGKTIRLGEKLPTGAVFVP